MSNFRMWCAHQNNKKSRQAQMGASDEAAYSQKHVRRVLMKKGIVAPHNPLSDGHRVYLRVTVTCAQAVQAESPMALRARTR